MATRSGKLSAEDKAAFLQTSQRLGLDPFELGALVQLESSFNPDIQGGDGGNYRGLIQFGPGARQEVGLPDKSMTIAEQLPYVEKYFNQRGFKPGMGIEKAYATVLVGNPGGNLNAKDSFGTSVGSAAPRMKPGGDLYRTAQTILGDVQGVGAAQPTTFETGSTTNNQYGGIDPQELLKSTIQSFYGVSDNQGSGGDIIFNVLNTVAEKQKPKKSVLEGVLNKFVAQYMPDFGQGDANVQTAKKKGSLLDEYIQSSIRSGYVDPTQLLGPLGLG